MTNSQKDRPGFTLVEWAVMFVIAIILVALLLPNVEMSRGDARRTHCKNHLKQIGLALHNYHDAYGSFPPAYISGTDGTPWHSWRVLILQYLDNQPIYDQYDFTKPWNDPVNIALADQLTGSPFRCYSGDESLAYVAVVGGQTMWPGESTTSLRDCKDGTSHTLAVVEVRGTGKNWMEPWDLQFDQISTSINPESGVGISSVHEGGANVLVADGSVRFLSEELPEETVRQLLIINDGGPTDW